MRAAMHHHELRYGDCQIWTMTGNEPGYATGPGEVKLRSILLPKEALDILASGQAVRILRDGGCSPIEGEDKPLIVFGSFKGNRPVLSCD